MNQVVMVPVREEQQTLSHQVIPFMLKQSQVAPQTLVDALVPTT
jgi:hypothetical protein